MYRTEKASFGKGKLVSMRIILLSVQKRHLKLGGLKLNSHLHIYNHLLTSSEVNVSLGP